MSNLQQVVTQVFERIYGQAPLFVVRAPGRVNLIGEHTDYNDGFVLPMAIDRAIWIALLGRADRQVIIHSLDYGNRATFNLDALSHQGEGWIEYAKGVAAMLAASGRKLVGWQGVMTGDVPVGAGLSSSAAVELATARAFAALSEWPWDPPAMAQIGQRAENEWVGVSCGIMDQMIAAMGQAGNALLIDCRSLAAEQVPLPPEAAVVVLDTGTRRGLVDSAYNERRQQCEMAAAFFGVPALRDVNLEEFTAKADELDPLIRRRARHVITENDRTLQAAQVMRLGDAAALGRLMNSSHVSLRDDFEVSSRELDVMVQSAWRHEACYGARMTGAGFGGCAVALVAWDAVTGFVDRVAADYQSATGFEPKLYVCRPADGAESLVL